MQVVRPVHAIARCLQVQPSLALGMRTSEPEPSPCRTGEAHCFTGLICSMPCRSEETSRAPLANVSEFLVERVNFTCRDICFVHLFS